MMIYRHTVLFFAFWICLLSDGLYAQSGCSQESYVKRIGTASGIERGYSLAYAASEAAIYIGGFKDDSVSILKMNLQDEIEWIRTFDIVPGQPDHVRKLIVDSDGMIVVTGVAGPLNTLGIVFAFRYDPNNDLILWAKSYLSYTNNFNHGLEELTPGDDFVMSNNPSVGGNNDEQLLRLSRLTGEIIPEETFHYDLGDSDALNDMILFNGFLYANGRFTDGPDFQDMRNTLIKIDPVTGIPVWTILGHVSGNSSARIYGAGMVIDQGAIFSISLGDDNGTSGTNTDIWIQKTNIDGQVLWMNKYNLPGTGDFVDQIITVDDGFVILARSIAPAKELFMFQIDSDGVLRWATRFDFPGMAPSLELSGARHPMKRIGDHLYFTAYATQNADADLIIVKTNLEGMVNDSCDFSAPANITVTPVSNPVFENVDPNVFTFEPNVIPRFPLPKGSVLPSVQDICITNGYILHEVQDTICAGAQLEGYTIPGVYTDTFPGPMGCDSIRILTLSVFLLETYVQQEICEGSQFEGYTDEGNYIDTLHAMAGGCDTLRHLSITFSPPILITIDRSICTGNNIEGYEESGMYIDTFTTLEGCDSIRILNLEVTDVLETFIDVEICPGQQYQVYTQPGIYIDTFISIFGCDSIRTLELSVTIPEIYVKLEICAGGQFDGYSQPGIYVDTLYAAPGICDTLRQLTLTVAPPIEESLSQTICRGEQYDGYMEAGMYIDTFSTLDDCDSIRILTLDVAEQMQTMLDIQICQGQQYEGYSHTGIYMDTFATSFGCDSIITLQLEVTPPNETFIEAAFCEGYKFGYTTSGTYVDTLTTDIGCDSIRTVAVQENAMYIPNVFSPNGDGVNDVFEITSFPVDTLDLDYFAIYDRYGNMALETKTWPARWNGTGKDGKVYNPGVYTYVMTFICQNEKQVLTGDITLIR